MSNPATDSKMVKSIGASGQISLGKEFAGRQVLIESPAKGVWIIRTATITPDHEPWPEEEKAAVKRQQEEDMARLTAAEAQEKEDLERQVRESHFLHIDLRKCFLNILPWTSLVAHSQCKLPVGSRGRGAAATRGA